jgi:hypothetical protein
LLPAGVTHRPQSAETVGVPDAIELKDNKSKKGKEKPRKFRGGSFLSKLQSFALQIGIPAAAAGTAAVMTSDGGITLAATVVSTAASQIIHQLMKMRRRRLPEDMRVEIESNIERLKKLLEDVEDKKDTLTENDYLKIMNELKDLYDETQAGYMVDMPSSISDSKLKGRERATRPIPALENRNTRTPAPARGSVAIPMIENPISRARGSGKKLLLPATYLKKARSIAKQAGYESSKLKLADDGIHKLQITTPDGKIVRFGRLGYSDFILTGDDTKRAAYLKRTAAIKGDWADNKFSPNNLARRILWGK